MSPGLERALVLVLRGLTTLVLAAVAGAFLGYWASLSLFWIYGGSGHPPIPAAPTWVYVGLYIVVLPAACLTLAWRLVGADSKPLAARRRRPAG